MQGIFHLFRLFHKLTGHVRFFPSIFFQVKQFDASIIKRFYKLPFALKHGRSGAATLVGVMWEVPIHRSVHRQRATPTLQPARFEADTVQWSNGFRRFNASHFHQGWHQIHK